MEAAPAACAVRSIALLTSDSGELPITSSAVNASCSEAFLRAAEAFRCELGLGLWRSRAASVNFAAATGSRVRARSPRRLVDSRMSAVASAFAPGSWMSAALLAFSASVEAVWEIRASSAAASAADGGLSARSISASMRFWAAAIFSPALRAMSSARDLTSGLFFSGLERIEAAVSMSARASVMSSPASGLREEIRGSSAAAALAFSSWRGISPGFMFGIPSAICFCRLWICSISRLASLRRSLVEREFDSVTARILSRKSRTFFCSDAAAGRSPWRRASSACCELAAMPSLRALSTACRSVLPGGSLSVIEARV